MEKKKKDAEDALNHLLQLTTLMDQQNNSMQ